ELTRCVVVTRSSKSESWMTIHWKPKLSERRRTFDPESLAATPRSSSRSRSACMNSPAESGLKTTAATRSGFRPSSVSSVICAVESAKSRSRFAPLSFLRPKRTSPSPNRLLDRPAHLLGDLGEAREALLERRVRGEELAERRFDVRRDDEEGVHALDLAQVALRDPGDVARDLLQRAHQLLGRACDEGCPAIRCELPVAGDRPDEDEADDVGRDRNEEDDEPGRCAAVPVSPATAEHAPVKADAGKQRGEHGEEAGQRHD